MLFVTTGEVRQRSEAEVKELSEQVGTWWVQHAQSGEIVNGQQLQGPETATTVRHDRGSVTIVDGTFIEAKEHVAGYGVIDVPDLDAAAAADRRALDLASSPAERALISSRLAS